MSYFLKKNIGIIHFYFNKYNTYIILTSYLCLTICASLLFSFKFTSLFPEITNNNSIRLENIPFNIGNLINNLLHNSSYKVQMHGIDFYLDRLPFVAFTTIIISKISSNIFFFINKKYFFFFIILLHL